MGIRDRDSAALRPYTQPDAFYALRRALADYLDGKYSQMCIRDSTCTRCGYTELYKEMSDGAMDVLDFLIGG